MKDTSFIFEVIGDIEPKESLKNFKKKIRDKIPKIDAEYIITYNPEKWRYHVYYFVNDLEKVKTEKGVTFTILHISY